MMVRTRRSFPFQLRRSWPYDLLDTNDRTREKGGNEKEVEDGGKMKEREKENVR